MRLNLSKVCAAGLLIASFPALGVAQTPPLPQMAPPAPSAQSAHIWVTDGNEKRELALSQVQVARTEQGGIGHSAGGSMLTSLGSTALSVVAGPIGAVASSVFNMFGHHPARPSFRAVLALAGQHSPATLSTNSPAFEIDYANTPGLDPDSYAPAILELSVTKDNWRLVSASSSSDPSALTEMMMPAAMPMTSSGSQASPTLTEDRVAAASIVMLGRGHAKITLSQPLQPGEYGIVLRPVQNAPSGALQPVLRSVWDFSVPDQTPHR